MLANRCQCGNWATDLFPSFILPIDYFKRISVKWNIKRDELECCPASGPVERRVSDEKENLQVRTMNSKEKKDRTQEKEDAAGWQELMTLVCAYRWSSIHFSEEK